MAWHPFDKPLLHMNLDKADSLFNLKDVCWINLTITKEEAKFEQVLLESDELKTNSAAATRVYSSPKGIPFSSTKHNLSASGSTTIPTSYFPFLISSHIPSIYMLYFKSVLK